MNVPCRRLWILVACALVGAACGSPPGPPGPGEARGAIPDLRRFKVMVLPVQVWNGVPRDAPADLELAHALRTRGEDVTWVFPPELEEALQRSPGVQARLEGLPVRVFLQAEVNRIGDPLFGDLVRLSGLTGADVAILPVELKRQADSSLSLAAALVGVRTGRVSWYGVVKGQPGPADAPGTLASTAEALARVLLPFGPPSP